MAEAFARIHGANSVTPFSAGSKPSGKINPKAISAMNELGYDFSKHTSKSLDELPNIEFDAVVTMGCGDSCPWIPANLREDWDIPDPKDMPENQFREIRNLIEEKVKNLLSRLNE